MHQLRVIITVLLVLLIQIRAEDPFTNIINGKYTSIEEYPYYAYLAYKSRHLKCGGAILTPNLILTAAHCLKFMDFVVYTGVNIESDLWNSQPYKVKKVVFYPKYKGQVGFDIGLVKLIRNIKLGPKVQTVAISKTSPPLGSVLSVVGFGKKDCNRKVFDSKSNSMICSGPNSKFLRSAIIKVVKHRNRVIYTKGNNQNTCYGDSGGPVFYKDKVVGLVSSGQYADCTGYDTHVAVAPYYEWITKYMDSY